MYSYFYSSTYIKWHVHGNISHAMPCPSASSIPIYHLENLQWLSTAWLCWSRFECLQYPVHLPFVIYCTFSFALYYIFIIMIYLLYHLGVFVCVCICRLQLPFAVCPFTSAITLITLSFILGYFYFSILL